MKSIIIRMFALSIVFTVMVVFISTVASAEDVIWSLDSSTSDAVLFQGSTTNPLSLNTGVARVTGKVSLGADLNHSVVDLSIFPSDENWARALTQESDLLAGYVPDETDHTLLTFKSKRIVKTTDGRLELIGDLTLTQVQRSVSMVPSEAYAGPVYGEPVIHSETHETAFFFSSVNSQVLSRTSQAAALQTEKSIELSGSTHVYYEKFPQLLSAVRNTNWPDVVKDEECRMPSTIGEDYSGAGCTGTIIAASSKASCQMPASVGDDYSGPVCIPAAGNQTTIVLDLKLVSTGSKPAVGMLSATAR
jgi:polyisoprenoid-binding protein YceI